MADPPLGLPHLLSVNCRYIVLYYTDNRPEVSKLEDVGAVTRNQMLPMWDKARWMIGVWAITSLLKPLA